MRLASSTSSAFGVGSRTPMSLEGEELERESIGRVRASRSRRHQLLTPAPPSPALTFRLRLLRGIHVLDQLDALALEVSEVLTSDSLSTSRDSGRRHQSARQAALGDQHSRFLKTPARSGNQHSAAKQILYPVLVTPPEP